MFNDFVAAALANQSMKAVALVNGAEIRGVDLVVRADTANRKIKKLSLVDTSRNPWFELCSLNEPQIIKFFEAFGPNKGFTKATYRNVKTVPEWQAVYAVKPLLFQKELDKKTRAWGSVWLDATPCRECGIVLPLAILTVDHQKAQAGGGTAAIARVFRGLGLTIGSPTGVKGLATQQTYAAGLGGNAFAKQSKDDKSSMNNAGVIYYTVFKEAKALPQLEEACLHHFLNLRPVCGPCNSSLRNMNIF